MRFSIKKDISAVLYDLCLGFIPLIVWVSCFQIYSKRLVTWYFTGSLIVYYIPLLLNYFLPHVVIKEDKIFLRFLVYRRCININDIVYYNVNGEYRNNLFCKSKENIILFLKSKEKVCISLNDQKYIISLLNKQRIEKAYII